jgi:1-phosphofructokinase family hexose kinase
VLIAGPNLTFDRTGRIEQLRPGEVLRFENVRITPGGKGVNVARATAALGHQAELVAFVPGRTGRAAAEMIVDEGLRLTGVPASGELRSTAVIREHGGRVTVLNEPGPALETAEWHAYEAAVARLLEQRHAVLACSGSLPPGSPSGAYGRLVSVAHERSALALVDAAGPALAGALSAGADLVVPNLGEAEALLSGPGSERVDVDPSTARRRAADAAAALVRRGAGAAAVTAGAAGLAFADGERTRWVPAPRVEVVNPIGAGDAALAGLGGALERGCSMSEAVLAAVAAGSASVEVELAGALDPARARELLQCVNPE